MDLKFNKCVHLRDLRELVSYSAAKYGDKPAFRELGAEHKVKEYSFNQLKSDTEALGAKLLADNMAGRHFALIGESSYSYVVTYLSIVNWVGVIVPIDKELTADDIIGLLHKSDAEGIFFSDTFVHMIPDILAGCPDISCAVNISSSGEDRNYPSLQNLILAGKTLVSQGYSFDQNSELDVNRLCTILFTSGTTGANKGVMLCHRNLTSCLFASMSLFELPETTFSVLPINHSYEFNIHVLGSMYGGAVLCFNDSIKHVKDNLKIFKPYMSLMVPMIVEGLHKNIWKEAEKANLAKHLKYGIWYSNLIRKFGIDQRRLFFKPIHTNLGGNLKTIVCGGAPLNQDLVKGFDDIGISVYNGYGITECSPLISSNSPLYNLPGSVGVVVPGCEVRIGEKNMEGIGEIQVRGSNVMLGYYKDDDATRRSFTDDGWFKTGDLGYLNKKGIVYITGREKNLIILPNGKNVHPEEIEEHLVRRIDYIREVVVYAQLDEKGNDSIITAIAYLDRQFTDTMGMDRAKEMFEEDINRVNRHLAVYKRISQALIRDTEFEKTTTKKIKRNAINKGGVKNA